MRIIIEYSDAPFTVKRTPDPSSIYLGVPGPKLTLEWADLGTAEQDHYLLVLNVILLFMVKVQLSFVLVTPFCYMYNTCTDTNIYTTSCCKPTTLPLP